MEPLAQTQGPEVLLKYNFERLSDSPASPPDEYTFVPKGDVYVTRHCRDLTAASSKIIYVVYDPRNKERLGLHCPAQIVEAVFEDAAATAEKRERAVLVKDSRDRGKARRSLFEHFPSIPVECSEEILNHGFLKGSGRVGRSTKLEEDVKIELAVNAHIRHRFTDYDSYFKQNKVDQQAPRFKAAARTRVYNQVKEIADSWRSKPSSTKSNGQKRYSLRSKDSSSANKLRQSSQRMGGTQASKFHAKSSDSMDSLTRVLGDVKFGDDGLERGFQNMNLDHNSRGREEFIAPPVHNRGSRHKAERKANRKAEIKNELECLKADPQHPLTTGRMTAVLQQHKVQGGAAASLGSDIGAMVGAEKAGRKPDEKRSLKIKDRKRRREERARVLLGQYRLNPNVEMTRKQKTRVLRMQREESGLGKARSHHSTNNPKRAKKKATPASRTREQGETAAGRDAKAEAVHNDSEWMEIS